MDDSSEEEETSKAESPTAVPSGSNNLLEDLLGMDTGPVSTGLEQIQFGSANTGSNDLLGEMFGNQQKEPNLFDAGFGQSDSGYGDQQEESSGWADAFGDTSSSSK